MLPFATTTIAVLVADPAEADDEPYSGHRDRYVPGSTGVRAVISRPSGREQIAGGEQAIWDFDLHCDPVDVDRTDLIRDENTGVDYRIVWIWDAGEHIEAGLRLVQGEV